MRSSVPFVRYRVFMRRICYACMRCGGCTHRRWTTGVLSTSSPLIIRWPGLFGAASKCQNRTDAVPASAGHATCARIRTHPYTYLMLTLIDYYIGCFRHGVQGVCTCDPLRTHTRTRVPVSARVFLVEAHSSGPKEHADCAHHRSPDVDAPRCTHGGPPTVRTCKCDCR